MFRRIPLEISVAPPSAAPPGRFAPRAKGMVRGSFPKNTDFGSCWGNDPVISFEAGGKGGRDSVAYLQGPLRLPPLLGSSQLKHFPPPIGPRARVLKKKQKRKEIHRFL